MAIFKNGITGNLDEQDLGMPTIRRAATATLYVSPNGNNKGGSSWTNAYTTIPGALAVASTDANECTLILIAINTGTSYYDIATNGDPTYLGNYILKGTHRTWTKIKNDNNNATSILKFTGYVSLIDLNFNLGVSGNGVIITKGAFRVRHCQFVGEDLGATATALHIDGATLLKNGIVENCFWQGNTTKMTGLLIDNCCCSNFHDLAFHDCFKGIQIVNAGSIENTFTTIDIGGCDDTVAVEGADGIAIDIDAGIDQHFETLLLHGNTINITDAVGSQHWNNVNGEFPITIVPDNFTGTEIPTEAGGGTDWGADTQIIASATKPFKVVATVLEGDAAELFRVRLSNDSGSTFFSDLQFKGALNEWKSIPSQASSSTDYIFNIGDRISASAKSESGDNSAYVWLKIQEI